MRQAGRKKKISVWFLTAALTVGMVSGCGDSAGTGTNGGAGSSAADSGSAKQEQDEIAMGRYVESDAQLNENRLTDWNSRVFQMADGSLLLADNSGFVLRSRDNGASWAREELAWLTKMREDDKYIRYMAFGSDQTAAVVWTQPIEQQDAGDGVQLDLNMKLTIVKPDGTEIAGDVPGGETIDSVYITDDGRILVGAFGNTLYETKEDGSMETFLTVDDGTPDLVRFHGDIMLMDGWGYETPLLYDMEEKRYIEDEVLEEFVEENFSDREYYKGRSYDLFLLSGDDDAIYVAGQKGVYRHVLGGSAMEQVIDGSLSSLNNPANTIMDMMAVENDEFLVLFTQGRVARFVYDPDIPARPDERLQIWSLEEEEAIRQAASVYQKNNPAVYVEYEIGLTPGQPMTRDDVIKNLNTSIMAGDGPDVLILDDMPLESYIEKGILADVSPVLESLSGDEAVFTNVAEAFKRDGKVYAMPCEIQLPYLFGRTDDLNKMTGVSEIADTMEELRKSNPGMDLLRVPSEWGIMRLFSLASAPAWRTADGALNQEAIQDFLTQAKRMYDAEMEGLSAESLDLWESASEAYQEYDSVNGGKLEYSDKLRMNSGEGVYFMAERQQFMAGSLSNINGYDCLTSVPVTEGFEDCGFIPMTGQCSHVFWAKTLVGINAVSENADMAQEFLKTVLGGEVQKDVEGGLPVNRQAILDNYADQRQFYEGNDYVSGIGSLYADDGEEVTLLIRVPDEAKVNELIQWIESMDTAYVEDAIFENVVYEEGQVYMQGEKSLTEAMESIETRAGIYLAE